MKYIACLLLTILLNVHSAYALSCIKPFFMRDAQRSELLVRGTVEEMTEGRIELRVVEVLKGEEERKIIQINIGGWAYWNRPGLSYKPGTDLVFAISRSTHPKEQGQYRVKLCDHGPLEVSSKGTVDVEMEGTKPVVKTMTIHEVSERVKKLEEGHR